MTRNEAIRELARRATQNRRTDWDYARLMYSQGKMSLREIARMMDTTPAVAMRRLGIWYG